MVYCDDMDVSALTRKLWHWFDEYFLLAATAFLIILIPLYPKIPLAEIIPGYIVRLRLEDLCIGLVAVWWGIQLLRRQVTWRTPLSWFILLYIAVGLLSNLVGVFVIHTIPAEWLHIGKSMLHWGRHIQYFSLFFIAYNAVKNRKQAIFLVLTVILTLLGVIVYGYGQKYHYWPVFSTMNREFSKGIRLYLGEYARVQSTFAGHYDLGAYLVIILPLVLATFFGLRDVAFRRRWLKRITSGVLAFLWLSGLWLLVMSASRTSFIGYLAASGLVVALYLWQRGWRWGISRGFVVLLVSVTMMLSVGDLSTRFSQVIDENRYPIVTQVFKVSENFRKHPLAYLGVMQPATPPPNAISTDQVEQELNQQGMTVSDTQPTAEKPKDVYTDVPEKEFELGDPAATLAGELKQVGDKLVQERVFSDCSLEHSLSVCIRLETLWPQAFAGFARDPLFGSGYATLTKTTVEQFTEAESTDNNFLRTLGENGAVGFFFYYGAIGLALWYSWQAYRRSDDSWLTIFAIANFAGTIGLLINASYIDVFVASKVAYTFWTLQGVFIAVFVKEGLITPRFNFAKQKQDKDSAQLRSLLQAVEKTAQDKSAPTQYLSPKKRRQKSSKKRRTTQKRSV